MRRIVAFSVWVVCCLTGMVRGQIPQQIHYDGWYEVAGVPYTGEVLLSLRLFGSVSNGVCWYEDRDTVVVEGGYYFTVLGDTTVQGSLTNALITGQAFLEVWVNGILQGPRTPFLPEAYALMADRVREGGVTAGMIAAGAIESAHLAGGAVTASKVASGAIDSQHLAPGAVSGPAIADGSIGLNDLAVEELDERYVGWTPGHLLATDSFVANPFLNGWTNNAYASWVPGAIRIQVAAPNPQGGVAVYTNRQGGPLPYQLSFRLLNTTAYGVNVRVLRDQVQVAFLSNARMTGVYTLAWTASWNRISFEGVGYYQPQYLNLTDFSLSVKDRMQVGALFVDQLFTPSMTMDALSAVQIGGLTNLVGAYDPNGPSPTLRIASATPPYARNSGSVLIETASGVYGTIPGNVVLRPGSTPVVPNGRGGSVEFYCGRGGSRPNDGVIRFYGFDAMGTQSPVAEMNSVGNWAVTGTVSAGGLNVAGPAVLSYVPPQGNLSMGTFTNRAP